MKKIDHGNINNCPCDHVRDKGGAHRPRYGMIKAHGVSSSIYSVATSLQLIPKWIITRTTQQLIFAQHARFDRLIRYRLRIRTRKKQQNKGQLHFDSSQWLEVALNGETATLTPRAPDRIAYLCLLRVLVFLDSQLGVICG